MNKEMIKLPKIIHDDVFDINIKPYLTVEEVEFIATEMMKCTDYCAMEICKNQYLMKICCKDENFDGIDYEALKHSGLFDAIYFCVTNLDEIDNYIKHATSINTQLNEFLKSIAGILSKAEKKIPKETEIKKILSQLQQINK